LICGCLIKKDSLFSIDIIEVNVFKIYNKFFLLYEACNYASYLIIFFAFSKNTFFALRLQSLPTIILIYNSEIVGEEYQQRRKKDYCY